MNLRQLGSFFILLGVIGVGIGIFNSSPSETEEAYKRIDDRTDEMAANARLLGVAASGANRDMWHEKKTTRERIMYFSYGIGGFLLFSGLICRASQPEPKP